jgi:hypothetical protein
MANIIFLTYNLIGYFKTKFGSQSILKNMHQDPVLKSLNKHNYEENESLGRTLMFHFFILYIKVWIQNENFGHIISLA